MASGEPRKSGRKKGTKNRATLEREAMVARASEAELARRAVLAAEAAQKPLAREVLDSFMHVFAGMAARVQPTPENKWANEEDFIKWARLACATASELAPYQSPRFKAEEFRDPRDLRNIGVPALPPPTGSNVVPLPADSVGRARMYSRMLDGDEDERAAS